MTTLKQNIEWKTTKPGSKLIVDTIDLNTDREREYKCSIPLVVFFHMEDGHNGPGPYIKTAVYVPAIKEWITDSYEYIPNVKMCKWSNIEY